MDRGTSRFGEIISALLSVACGAICWEAAIRLGLISSLAVPLPSAVICIGLPELLTRPALEHFSVTLAEWAVSFLVGGAAGVLLGFVVGVSSRTSILVEPLLSFLRAVPPIALFPVALVALGPGKLSIAAVATVGAGLYVFPVTADAAKLVAANLRELATLLGASRLRFLVTFVMPGTVLYALAAARVAATYSFAICIAGEMVIGGRRGVGAAIMLASERYSLETAYAYILSTGVVGVFIDYIAHKIVAARFRLAARSIDATAPGSGGVHE
jgi:ABC-type nitrate/sulfonate/bicarbonate transport system permease component